MYQQDYLLSEARKLAQLLARLMGLKVDGPADAYQQQLNHILQNEYDTGLETLLNLSAEAFETHLLQTGYSAEKLNALGTMLYVFAQPFKATDETLLTLKKVLLIFNLLEQKHHFQSFENIDKRNTIYRFLTTPHERP